jgi:hypothetical protein
MNLIKPNHQGEKNRTTKVEKGKHRAWRRQHETNRRKTLALKE